MKSVLIIIKPKYCELIASGKKTIEVRKSAPKIETPFKVYIYQTKSKDNAIYKRYKVDDMRSGKVIGEFVCDCVTPLYNVCFDDWERLHGGLHKIEKQLTEMACLTEAELHKYAKGKNCFAWHISDLKIYDKPKELSEFYRECEKPKCESCPHLIVENTPNSYETYCEVNEKLFVTRAPQSWMYVEELR